MNYDTECKKRRPQEINTSIDSKRFKQSTDAKNIIKPSSVLGKAPEIRINKSNSHDLSFKISSNTESDEARIQSRLKQIKFGKNTLGYDNYIKAVKRENRIKFNPEHPVTPDVYKINSKKGFDGIVKAWRRALHKWDATSESISDLDGLVEFTSQSTLKSPSKNKEINKPTYEFIETYASDDDLDDVL